MNTNQSDPASLTGFAVFDEQDRLLEANSAILDIPTGQELPSSGTDKSTFLKLVFSTLLSFGGQKVKASGKFVQTSISRWADASAGPVEAETKSGRWKLLTTHPRPGGGTAFISTDITRLKEVELSVRAKTESFKTITDSHPLPVFVVDPETSEILYESLDASRLAGREWAPDKPQLFSDHYVDHDDLASLCKRLEKDDIIRDHVVRFKRSDGSFLWISANCRAGVYEGRPCIVLGVLDVTRRKEQEDLFAVLVRHHPMPVWMNDAKSGDIIFASEAAQKLFGWSDISTETPPHMRNHFVDDDEYYNVSKALDESPIVENYEAMLKRADGSEFWATGNLRKGEYQGRQVILSGIADLTRQRERAAEILKARELLADAIESLSEGFALFDEAGKLIMCNSVYREMNHLVAELIVPGMEWAELMRESAYRGAYQDAIGREDEWVAERLQNGIEFIDGYELNSGDGNVHSVSIHPTDLGGFVVTRIDITEQKRIEAAEREADAVVRQVLDSCPVPIQLSSIVDGTILYRNPAHFALMGEKKTAYDYFADPSRRPIYIDSLLKNERLERHEEMLVNAQGKTFPASVSARLFEFQGENVIVSVIFDETERIEAKRKLEQANARLTDAIESLSEGFALYGNDDRLVMANERYRTMHAVSADALVEGVNWFDFLRVAAERNQFPVEPDKIDEWLEERAKDRSEYRQAEFQHSDGTWFLVTNSPTREGGFVVTRADITERKNAEAAQREADALVSRVLEASPVNLQMTRARDGRLLYRSPATKALFGEVKTAIDYYVDPKSREPYIKELLETGAVDDFETQLWRADGQPCWCSISSRLIDFHGENVVVSHTYDLTDRIEMQEELERQRETLHQNEKLSALGELLAGVAHELNNPLSVVVGQSLLLQETAIDSKTKERADKIGAAADRCARIVKIFLAMARQQPAKLTNVSVNDVVESSLEVAGYSMKASGIDLDLQLGQNLPPVWGDSDQLSQVFINLLVNAEQALGDWEGRRKIKIASRLNKKTGMVVIKIADSGPGIPEEIVSRIFEPFFTTKEVGSGTGIGLSFCHRIVTTHNGSIRVTTPVNGGTAFFIYLPASSQKPGPTQSEETETQTQHGISVLVVDDEPEVGELIAEILSRNGYATTMANSGPEALKLLAANNYAVVLSDLKMPDMGGPKLLEHIREHHSEHAERLGFITGDTMSPSARAFLDSSGRPFLEKPIKPDELRRLVTGLLEKSG